MPTKTTRSTKKRNLNKSSLDNDTSISVNNTSIPPNNSISSSSQGTNKPLPAASPSIDHHHPMAALPKSPEISPAEKARRSAAARAYALQGTATMAQQPTKGQIKGRGRKRKTSTSSTMLPPLTNGRPSLPANNRGPAGVNFIPASTQTSSYSPLPLHNAHFSALPPPLPPHPMEASKHHMPSHYSKQTKTTQSHGINNFTIPPPKQRKTRRKIPSGANRSIAEHSMMTIGNPASQLHQHPHPLAPSYTTQTSNHNILPMMPSGQISQNASASTPIPPPPPPMRSKEEEDEYTKFVRSVQFSNHGNGTAIEHQHSIHNTLAANAHQMPSQIRTSREHKGGRAFTSSSKGDMHGDIHMQLLGSFELDDDDEDGEDYNSDDMRSDEDDESDCHGSVNSEKKNSDQSEPDKSSQASDSGKDKNSMSSSCSSIKKNLECGKENLPTAKNSNPVGKDDEADGDGNDSVLSGDWFDVDMDSPEFYQALEAELGGLMEEDLEAATNTLLSAPICDSKQTMSSIPGTPSTNSWNGSNHAISSTKTIMTTPSSPATSLTSTPQTDINNKHSNMSFPPSEGDNQSTCNSRSSATPLTETKKYKPPPTPSEEQLIQLRSLISKHYQTLVQQTVLAVRAAQTNKVQKDNPKEGAAAAALMGSGSGKKMVSRDLQKNFINGNLGIPIGNTVYLGVYNKESSWENDNSFFLSGETADDLVEILDGAVGMLQDLDGQRKDAVRYFIQMERTRNVKNSSHSTLPSGVLSISTESSNSKNIKSAVNMDTEVSKKGNAEQDIWERRLTRSEFTRTLRERTMDKDFNNQVSSNGSWKSNVANISNEGSSSLNSIEINKSAQLMGGLTSCYTTFGLQGLSRLHETFSAIDNSVNARNIHNFLTGNEVNILVPSKHEEACELLLRHARADYCESSLPCHLNLSQFLSYPAESTRDQKCRDLDEEEEIESRRNRNQFTTAEDNLLLRGVNLFGEKEWLLISDRYLPDRSVSAISQRYARLCMLLYRANGINIDKEGELDPPPEHPNGADDFDEEAISKLSSVSVPANFNVHRWSLEEDITLLKAVPLMGHMWAEVAMRLIPHRDRGHLRKRYQVLQRRVKASIKRVKKVIPFTKGKVGKSKKITSQKVGKGGKTKYKNKKQLESSPDDIYVPQSFEKVKKQSKSATSLLLKSGTVVDQSKLSKGNFISDPVSGESSFSHGNKNLKGNKIVKGHSKISSSQHTNSVLDKSNAQHNFTCATKGSYPTLHSLQHPSQALISSTHSNIHSKGFSFSNFPSDNNYSNTHAGVSKILDGAESCWTNMSSIHKLIDGGESSKFRFDSNPSTLCRGDLMNLPGTGAQLSHPIKRNTVEKLPNLSLDASGSGFSMFNVSQAGNEQQNGNTVELRKNINKSVAQKSIMSSVLNRTTMKEKKSPLPLSSNIKLLAENSMKPSLSTSLESSNSFRNALLGSSAGMSSRLNNDTATFPVPEFTSTHINGPGTDSKLNFGYSMDGFAFSNFELLNESKKAFDHEQKNSSQIKPLISSNTNLSQFTSQSPQSRGLYVGGNFIDSPDLDAISALNQMSNSCVFFRSEDNHKDASPRSLLKDVPISSLKQPKSASDNMSINNTSSDIRKKEDIMKQSNKPKKERPSFLAKVMSGIEDKKESRRKKSGTF
eukprot:CAMPEP_0184860388 /NCGR_PEP_ID=MMETSP0580-20130426/5288_1 /TAXON_ID=1118495 /ORGANISM="Dactyliosolen fragilissimus" /LENGTH=1649 /DNA_ID=CAMNT_0027357477 /DNA_START=36 /DNA_END=4985 /DNA_ORIENTATION=+